MAVLPVSVVVLTRNSEGNLQECLEAVQLSNPQELIIIDGGSTDKTLEVARRYTDKLYFDGGQGITHAYQLGAELATGEYLAYVDSDVILFPDTLTQMLGDLRMKGWAAIGARVISSPLPESVASSGIPKEEKIVDNRCAIFQRDLVLKYRFDPTMPNCDVLDISYKLAKHGHKVGLSSTYIIHKHDARSRGGYWIGVATAEFCLRYWRSPRAIVEFGILRGLLSPSHRALLSLVRGDFRGTFRGLRGQVILTGGFLNKIWATLAASLKRNNGHKDGREQ